MKTYAQEKIKIYCDNEHKKKALSRPDADTSGTQKKKNNIVFYTRLQNNYNTL